ncbi:MAG: hypothetical protein IJT11_01205 [Bacteroidaceae bacterium]|nr:hypothetical protein [Bacteroidaceae bacterium]
MNSRFRRAMLTRCFREIQQHPDTDHAQKVMPLLQEALQRTPRNKNNRRYVSWANDRKPLTSTVTCSSVTTTSTSMPNCPMNQAREQPCYVRPS